ncbi:hypothetical protein [Acidianus brierleyi]|uniref:Uncharacterized protein n=1 Tax=Acidianus brierleyi TaxID=41673 RepID=A0A2U9IEZ6_9CREN|nr:hypothetical protein [Acidianus brierleyi]AWR94570.1 hypothetical protein DFR85_08150 [Acidianus brierleyi]
MFEIFLDKLMPYGEKVLTDSGHVVTFSKNLSIELKNMGINIKVFAGVVADYFNEKSKSYSIYYRPLNMANMSDIFTRVFEFWVVYSSGQIQLFSIISNYKDISEITIIDPQLVTLELEKIMNFAKNYKTATITMPFLYKFLIFETFNLFRKNNILKFEGIIEEKRDAKYMMAVNKNLNAIIWKIDSTKLNYVNDISSEKIGGMVRNL